MVKRESPFQAPIPPLISTVHCLANHIHVNVKYNASAPTFAIGLPRFEVILIIIGVIICLIVIAVTIVCVVKYFKAPPVKVTPLPLETVSAKCPKVFVNVNVR